MVRDCAASTRAIRYSPTPPHAKRSARSILSFLGPFLSVFLALGLVGASVVLFLAFVWIAPRVPETADLWNINRQTSIVMLDRHGEELMARGARYGEAVRVDDLPDYLVTAFLSTEDRRFYDHHGVDIRGTIRAAITNFRSQAVVQGGSTITQQLAKNLFLSPERTIERKVREAMLALWLEGRYSKDEILSLYLNRIYLGAGAYGVEAAARTYFGKSASAVSLAEAAMLAGLPKAPSTLAPTRNIDGAARRSAEVLQNLLEIGAITRFEQREATLNPAQLAQNDMSPELGYAFDAVAARAPTIVGNVDGDLIITTTIDPKLQRDAETAIRSALTVETRLEGAEQAALITFDLDGAMRAMIGGRDYRDSQFNRALQAKRQPGSAFKPIVYVAALEAGIDPYAKYIDQPVNIDGWEPSNYADDFIGPMRLPEAVSRSINTISVQVAEEVGREKVIETARKLGIKAPLEPVPSIALGAVDLTLDELTAAYLPLARGGTRVEPYLIEEIRNQDGDILYTHNTTEPERIFGAKTAENINHLLYQVILNGTGRRANLGDRHAMGKTGTTNDWRDAWFVGYTGQMVTGVWVGNDAYNPMEKVTGGTVPAEIWRTFMLAAHQGEPKIRLAGAYPAKTYSDTPLLLDFYTDVTNGFRRIAREKVKDRDRQDRRNRNFRVRRSDW